MKYTPSSYKKLVVDLKQANNTIKQLREANEFKRIQIERSKKDFMIVATIISCALICSIAVTLILS